MLIHRHHAKVGQFSSTSTSRSLFLGRRHVHRRKKRSASHSLPGNEVERMQQKRRLDRTQLVKLDRRIEIATHHKRRSLRQKQQIRHMNRRAQDRQRRDGEFRADRGSGRPLRNHVHRAPQITGQRSETVADATKQILALVSSDRLTARRRSINTRVPAARRTSETSNNRGRSRSAQRMRKKRVVLHANPGPRKPAAFVGTASLIKRSASAIHGQARRAAACAATAKWCSEWLPTSWPALEIRTKQLAMLRHGGVGSDEKHRHFEPDRFHRRKRQR